MALDSAVAEQCRAAHETVVSAARPGRAIVRLYGRDPLRMLQGLATADVAGAPPGRAVPSALLTPKGKLVAVLRVVRASDDLLLDTERGALPGLLEALKKYIPPLFARSELQDDLAVWGFYGPHAQEHLSGLLQASLPSDLPPDGVASVQHGEDRLLVIRTADAGVGGYDVVGPEATVAALGQASRTAGARSIGEAALEVLRIEAGLPRWAAELDGTVIPLEVWSLERTISTTKGCYTGQEVIVRIMHRGHVNRHLRGVVLADQPVPDAGTPLLDEPGGREVGRVTSACVSQRMGGTIGLAFVRREIEPPADVVLGTAAAPVARVVALPFTHAPG